MKVWLVYVNKEVKHAVSNSKLAIKRLELYKDLDAWCMEVEIEEE